MEEDKRVETEEEIKERLKKEIMAELMSELEEKKENEESEVKIHKQDFHKVSFDHPPHQESLKTVPKKEVHKLDDEPKKGFELPRAADDGTDNKATRTIVIVSLIVLTIGVFFFPQIYKFVQDVKLSLLPNEKIPTPTDKPYEKLEKITLNSQIVGKLKYPVMKNNQYSKDSYYKRDIVTMSDFANNDILYNAFIWVNPGNIASYEGNYNGESCVTNETKKTFNARYIEARIANQFTKSTEYKHANFTVPSSKTINSTVGTNKVVGNLYPGTWKYDAKNNRYIYYGDCNPTSKNNAEYYDVKTAYNAEGKQSNTVIEVLYYVAFASVETSTKRYTLYSDFDMKNTISSGTLTGNDTQKELDEILKQFTTTNQSVSKYRYIFSSNDCSYKDYCFEKGEWIK